MVNNTIVKTEVLGMYIERAELCLYRTLLSSANPKDYDHSVLERSKLEKERSRIDLRPLHGKHDVHFGLRQVVVAFAVRQGFYQAMVSL